MHTEIVPTTGAAAAVSRERAKLDELRRQYAPKASDIEFESFAGTATTMGLSPQAQQIWAVSRFNKRTNRYELTVQLGINGLRLIAERSRQYAGTEEPLYCGPDGQWTDVWVAEEPPVACKVRVWRKGAVVATTGVAYYREFRQEQNGLWRTMPLHMLAIAAERHALRKAFQFDIEAAERSLGDAEITVDELPTDDPGTLPGPPTRPQLAAAAVPAAAMSAAGFAQLEGTLDSTLDAMADEVVDAVRATPQGKMAPAPPAQAAPPRGTATPPSAGAEATTTGARGGGARAESPAVQGFFATLRDQCGLDRAAVRDLLGIQDDTWDDTTALREASLARQIPVTPKGLAQLAVVAHQLWTERQEGDCDPMATSWPQADSAADPTPDELSDAVRVLRDDVEPTPA
jgi:hypothetical protein